MQNVNNANLFKVFRFFIKLIFERRLRSYCSYLYWSDKAIKNDKYLQIKYKKYAEFEVWMSYFSWKWSSFHE